MIANESVQLEICGPSENPPKILLSAEPCLSLAKHGRRDVLADVPGDPGGVGLVPRPARDHPDPQISLGHGLQQGNMFGNVVIL